MLLKYLADSYPEFTNEVMEVHDVEALPAPSADPADGSLLTWSPWKDENARPSIPFFVWSEIAFVVPRAGWP